MPKVIQTNKNSLYIIYSIISISILSLLFINNIYADESSNLNYSVTVEPALNITTSSNKVSLDLNPLNHDFDSQDLTVSVSTNNETGYKLYVNTENKTTQLMEKDDNSLYIDTLSSETPENNFTVNRWGYRIGSGNYLPFVSGTLINSSKTQIENNSSTLTFAAKVGYETKAGTYNLALNFQATANPLAKTIADAEYMQDVSSKEIGGCPADLTTGQVYHLKDSRDETTYYVAKLKDGNCWMIQNLRLGTDTTTLALTSDKSDVSSGGFTLDGKRPDGKFSWETVDEIEYVNDSSQYYCTDNYGCYYNWYTATGGSGTISVDTDGASVNYSICPAGWTLPTSGSTGQTQALADAYGGTGATAVTALLTDPISSTENVNGASVPGFLLGGFYENSGSNSIGVRGGYWTSTTYSDNTAHNLEIVYSASTKVVAPTGNRWKYNGMAVRCILK